MLPIVAHSHLSNIYCRNTKESVEIMNKKVVANGNVKLMSVNNNSNLISKRYYCSITFAAKVKSKLVHFKTNIIS